MSFVSSCGPRGSRLWSPLDHLIHCPSGSTLPRASKIGNFKGSLASGVLTHCPGTKGLRNMDSDFVSNIYPLFSRQRLTWSCHFLLSRFPRQLCSSHTRGPVYLIYWPMEDLSTWDLGTANGGRTESVPGSPGRKGEWTCRQAFQKGSQLLNPPSLDEVWEVSFVLHPDGWRALPAGRIEGRRRREGHSR